MDRLAQDCEHPLMLFAANFAMTWWSVWSVDQLSGILLLFAAACFYMVHMTSIRLWSVSWKEVIVVVPTVNVLLFTP